jgi:hypothetical protein
MLCRETMGEREGVHAPQMSVPPEPAQITVRSLNAPCTHPYSGGESTAPVAVILRSASKLPISPAADSRARVKRTEVNVLTPRDNAASLNFGDEPGTRTKQVNAVRRT